MGRKNLKPARSVLALKRKEGLTIIEIMVTVITLAMLILIAALSLKPAFQLAKAKDSERKTDLKRISTSLEDYAGDHPCYPTAIYQNNQCQPATEFAVYLRDIPCDPVSKKPYPYVRPNCKQYALYASLEAEKGETYVFGNYVVSSSNYVVPTGIPGPTSTPTSAPTTAPTATPILSGDYYGCFAGVCQPISGPGQCVPSYLNNSPCSGASCCYNQCGTPSNPLHQCI